jgi:hypothetical protein
VGGTYGPPGSLSPSVASSQDTRRHYGPLGGSHPCIFQHHPPQDAGARLRQTPLWPLFEAVAPTLAYDAATMGDSAVPVEQAAAVPIPLLALAGGASPAWMQQAARALADAAPRGRYGLLEGQTHEVAAEAIAPVLVEFFTAQ